METRSIEQRRADLSSALVNEAGAARFAAGLEDLRVDALLAEQQPGPHASQSRLARFGRTLLSKAGLCRPETPQLTEQHTGAESAQQKWNDRITEELDLSRELIRNNILMGIDGKAVDGRLGLRGSENSILPPLFRDLHRQAEEEAGGEISFLEWMADHATNDQLLNVWQWHDDYLSRLDNDPAFHEQVSSAKNGYLEGSRLAIAANRLHPDMTIQEEDLQRARIVHGSPFSPILATSNAYADRATGVIQIGKGVSDFVLYHEITHRLSGGMRYEFDEGITDLVAAEIYNQTRPESEHFDPRKDAYQDQIATLDAISRTSGGNFCLYEMSGIYAGPDPAANTRNFISQADKAIGLPIVVPLIKGSIQFIEGNTGKHDDGDVRYAARLLLRKQVEFLEKMMFDAKGNRVSRTPQELELFMLLAGIANKNS